MIVREVKLSDTRDYCQDIFNQWCYSSAYARGGWVKKLLELDILQKFYYLRRGD